jgi:hypothetical protein
MHGIVVVWEERTGFRTEEREERKIPPSQLSWLTPTN